jgi:hypothetical protein
MFGSIKCEARKSRRAELNPKALADSYLLIQQQVGNGIAWSKSWMEK